MYCIPNNLLYRIKYYNKKGHPLRVEDTYIWRVLQGLSTETVYLHHSTNAEGMHYSSWEVSRESQSSPHLLCGTFHLLYGMFHLLYRKFFLLYGMYLNATPYCIGCMLLPSHTTLEIPQTKTGISHDCEHVL